MNPVGFLITGNTDEIIPSCGEDWNQSLSYNALVCSHFAEEIGRTQVFQLPDHSSLAPGAKGLPRTVRGLTMPADDAWFEELLSKWHKGWVFHATPLTENFDFDQWTTSAPAGSMAILCRRPDGAVLFNSPEQEVKFQSATTILTRGATGSTILSSNF